MEINDLKSVWNGADESGLYVKHSMEEMKQMISKRSKVTIEQVKKDLNRKAFFFLFLGITMLIFLVDISFFEEPQLYLLDSLNQDQFVVLLGLMSMVVLLLSVFMFRVVRKISHDQNKRDSLRISLLEIAESIRKMMNVNVYADAVGVPLFSFFFFYIQFFKNQSLIPDWRIVFLPIIAVFLFWAVRKKMMIYQQGKYGHYLEDLTSNLRELDDIQEK